MAGSKGGRIRNLFGPLWAWVMIGCGLLIMASAFGLPKMGVSTAAAQTVFLAGAVIILIPIIALVIMGASTLKSWYEVYYLEGNDLSEDRRK